MRPWYDSGGVTIHVGHVLDVLAELPAGSIQTCITSPPYYGLRSYSTTPQIWGGSPDCDHTLEATPGKVPQAGYSGKSTLAGFTNPNTKGRLLDRQSREMAWQATAPGKVLTGGTGTASAKQVTNAGSQYGNGLVKADPLASEVGNAVTVEQLSETPATADIQVDTEGSLLGLPSRVESMRDEECQQFIGEEAATSAEGCTPRLIDTAVTVKDAADEIPDERLRDRRQANSKALAGQEIPGSQQLHERFTPEMPAVDRSAAQRALQLEWDAGTQEVPHESGTAFVQAHEADRARLADVAISEHQPQPIGEVVAHSVEAFPQDCVSGLGADELGSMGTARAGHGAESPQPFGVTMPAGAQKLFAAPLTGDDDTSIPGPSLALDGAMLADDGLMARDNEGDATNRTRQRDVHTPMICKKCGAVKCELGSEPTTELYIEHIVQVFRAVRRVLHDTGTVWCNLGDGYADKQLLMMPARVALALQADGWVLRSDIVWSKANPMPESVNDRPTKSHEYIFLLAKRPNYYFDNEAIREPTKPDPRNERWGQTAVTTFHNHTDDDTQGMMQPKPPGFVSMSNPAGRNCRSVWEIPTTPYPNAHFATFSPEIPRRAILAGTSARGCCSACRAPWIRRLERHRNGHDWNANNRAGGDRLVVGQSASDTMPDDYRAPTTLGWEASCACPPHEPVPQTVCDIFLGSGTTAYVARHHGRRAVGIELNLSYAKLAADRLKQGVLPLEVF